LNTTYESLWSFISNYKRLEIANTLFSVLGLEDIELLNEYMLVMKPFAGVLDIFRAKRGVS
jgi:hypothetical protein